MCIAFMENPSQSYGASHAIWDSLSVTGTCHLTQVNMAHLTTLTGWYLIYLPLKDGRLS